MKLQQLKMEYEQENKDYTFKPKINDTSSLMTERRDPNVTSRLLDDANKRVEK